MEVVIFELENLHALGEGIMCGSKKRAFQMEGTPSANVSRWEQAGLVGGRPRSWCDWNEVSDGLIVSGTVM